MVPAFAAMKILVVHPRLSVMGGGERVAIHSIKEALREGHEVNVATERFDVDAFEDFFGVKGLFKQVQLLTYPSFRPITHRAVLYQRLIHNQLRLQRIVSSEGPFDLVLNTGEIANQPSTRLPSIQYCYFPEYFSHLDANGSHGLWDLYYWPARTFYHERVSQVDRLLAVSDYTRGIVKMMWGRQSTTLYPPCPIELYKDLHLSKDDLVVTIGRIAPEKRMGMFAEIARKLPDLKFVIIGSVVPDKTRYFESLKSRAPSNLSIVVSPLRKVRDILGRAKVYVHCASGEHFGITIVESMAAGCVPVVHNSGGPREIVSEDVGYKWDTIQEAVDQTSRLMKDDGVRENLSKAGGYRAERFGSEAFESGLGKVLHEFG